MNINWSSVLPAITTPFTSHGSVDAGALARHARLLLDAGCGGLVPCGSLGEAATLTFEEKQLVIETAVAATRAEAPVLPGIAALSTGEAVRLAKLAERVGCSGLMVLPPYVYSTDAREMQAHVSAVIGATALPCMLYNNPPAYKTDFFPNDIVHLAEKHSNLVAVKESSGDVRRVTALRALAADRLQILVGLDDAVLEGLNAGAVGWVAGLVNAFPRESVALHRLARTDRAAAQRLYQWFLPLLRMDAVPKFVQLIKLAQERAGMGSARVRPPRLALTGEELFTAEAIITAALATRPQP